ncbi:hypothetical protein D3C86_627680 [compost metagenome]
MRSTNEEPNAIGKALSRIGEGVEALVDALMHLPREMTGDRLEQAFHAVDVAIDRSARHACLLREVKDVHLGGASLGEQAKGSLMNAALCWIQGFHGSLSRITS